VLRSDAELTLRAGPRVRAYSPHFIAAAGQNCPWNRYRGLVPTEACYLGFHFPLDVLAGAALGVVAVAVFSREFIYARLMPLVRLASTRPVVFYPIFVLIVEQMWEAFNGLVFVGLATVKLFGALSRHL
jgi:hypothetical protein